MSIMDGELKSIFLCIQIGFISIKNQSELTSFENNLKFSRIPMNFDSIDFWYADRC